MQPWINRERDGSISVSLDDNIREALKALLDELRELLLTGTHDGLRRLYPTAYPQDEQLDKGYRELVHDSLLAQRLEHIEAMENTLALKTVSNEQITAWMHAVNSVRLVLGTVLDVSEDDELPTPEHPDARQYALYYLLGLLLEQIIGVLFDTVPEEGTEGEDDVLL